MNECCEEISVEEDEPLYFCSNDAITALPEKYASELEHKANTLGKLQFFMFKEKAYKLIILFIAIIVILYFFDVFIINFGWSNSNLLTGIFEISKISISVLIGFVFSFKSFDSDK